MDTAPQTTPTDLQQHFVSVLESLKEDFTQFSNDLARWDCECLTRSV